MESYLFLRTTCSIQQLRHILIFCSELLEVTYSQDDTVCLCCWKLYRHFQWPISKDEKVIFLFCINKGSRIWFSTLSIDNHFHMCQEQNFSKSKWLALCCSDLSNLMHWTWESCPSVLIIFLCFFTTTPVLLPCGAMVCLLFHEFLH